MKNWIHTACAVFLMAAVAHGENQLGLTFGQTSRTVNATGLVFMASVTFSNGTAFLPAAWPPNVPSYSGTATNWLEVNSNGVIYLVATNDGAGTLTSIPVGGSGVGQAQTPLAQDVNAQQHSITNVNSLQAGGGSVGGISFSNQVITVVNGRTNTISSAGAGFQFNVPVYAPSFGGGSGSTFQGNVIGNAQTATTSTNAMMFGGNPGYSANGGTQSPVITISPVGLAQGLASNNGCMFGPDTPKTKTCGIQEAWNSVPKGTNWLVYDIPSATFQLFDGTYDLYTNVVMSVSNPFCLEIEGKGILATRILYAPTVVKTNVDVLGFYDPTNMYPTFAALPWHICLKDFTITPIQEIPFTTLIGVDSTTNRGYGSMTSYDSWHVYSVFEAYDVNFSSYFFTTNTGWGTGSQLSIGNNSSISPPNNVFTIGCRLRGGEDVDTLFSHCFFTLIADGIDSGCDHLTLDNCIASYVDNPQGAPYPDDYRSLNPTAGTLTGSGAPATYPNLAFLYASGATVIRDCLMMSGSTPNTLTQNELCENCQFWSFRCAAADFGNRSPVNGDIFRNCIFAQQGGSYEQPFPMILVDGGDGGIASQSVVSPMNGYKFPTLEDCSVGIGSQTVLPYNIVYGENNFGNFTLYHSSAWVTNCCWYGLASGLFAGSPQNGKYPAYQLWSGTNCIMSYYAPSNSGSLGPLNFAVETNATIRSGIIGQSVPSIVNGTNFVVNDEGGGIFVTNHFP